MMAGNKENLIMDICNKTVEMQTNTLLRKSYRESIKAENGLQSCLDPQGKETNCKVTKRGSETSWGRRTPHLVYVPSNVWEVSR